MNYRYNKVGKLFRRIYRRILPSVPSAYTAGHVHNICDVRFTPSDKLQKYFTSCIELLREKRDNDIGDYLEFGVFNGASLSDMFIVAKKLSIKTRLFGFDAFEGLPTESENEDNGVWKKGFYTCSFEDMQNCLRKKGIEANDIIWIKGWYDKTLTLEMASNYQINPGIVFIDCDTYSSSKTVLDFITPLIKKATIVSLDDWRLNDLDLQGLGEYKSFNEFVENNPQFDIKELNTYKRNSRSFLVTPR